jgi:hypothetical protein
VHRGCGIVKACGQNFRSAAAGRVITAENPPI